MPKPQPKSNLLHQLLLSEMLSNKAKTLVNNVSSLNIERSAKRWAR